MERKEGLLISASGRKFCLLDLPGTYSLEARTPDEAITSGVLRGAYAHEPRPDVVLAVADACNLERSLALILELREGPTASLPVVLAVNMMDLAKARGMDLDTEILSRELGIPVVQTVATRSIGMGDLLAQVEQILEQSAPPPAKGLTAGSPSPNMIRTRYKELDRILSLCVRRAPSPTLWTDRIDRVVLHRSAARFASFRDGGHFSAFQLGQILPKRLGRWLAQPNPT